MKNKVQDIPSSMQITNISNGLEQLNDISKTQQGVGGVTAQGIKTISGHIVQQPQQPPPPTETPQQEALRRAQERMQQQAGGVSCLHPRSMRAG